ncbi:unnamed protein product [Chrysoparadoxa australica]
MGTEVASPQRPEVNEDPAGVMSYEGWVKEFENFQGATGEPLPGTARSTMSSMGGKSSRFKPQRSNKEELNAEMKLLHWHKLANEAALKAALMKTKKVKSAQRTAPHPTNQLSMEGRAAWMQQVIDEERSKPLKVTKDFVEKYELQERAHEERMDREIAGHINSLRRLREQVAQREETQSRRAAISRAQREVEAERHQLLQGKLVTSAPSTRGEQQKQMQQSQRQEGPVVGALNTVLGSLDKLVDLEKRISSLEQGNVYDNYLEKHPEGTGARRGSGAGTGGRSRLSFTKQSDQSSMNAPARTFYVAKPSRGPSASLRGGSTTTGKKRLGGRRAVKQRGSLTSSSKSSGTFMTTLPDVKRGTRGAMHQRSAVMEQKRRAARQGQQRKKEETSRIARQDGIIRDWLQKKASQQSQVRVRGKLRAAGAAPRRGMGAGRHTSNPHLQQFHEIRSGYAKRKEKLCRDLRKPAGVSGAARGTRTLRMGGSGLQKRSTASSSLRPPAPSFKPKSKGSTLKAGRTVPPRGSFAGGGLSIGGTGMQVARARRSSNNHLPRVGMAGRKQASTRLRPWV